MTPRRYRPRNRSRSLNPRPLIAFLLIASFGILFAGCSSVEEAPTDTDADEFTFTAEDVARFRDLAESSASPMESPAVGTGVVLHADDGLSIAEVTATPTIDLSMAETYKAIRSGPSAMGGNLYRVTNEFLNVRAEANVTAASLERLDQGDVVTMVELLNAAWAKVEYAPSKQGYVALRYIAKMTSDEKLAEEKKAFDGLYFVDFGFVNVRKEPNAQSEKLGELPGQTFVKPISKDEVWARIPFQGKEGYVAMQYLSPFLPNFLVRQEQYTLPVLQYSLAQEGTIAALVAHTEKLRAEGIRLMTMREFANLLLQQEQRDVRLEPKSAIITVTDITPENVKALSDALTSKNIRATLFLQTRHVGINGITEKMLLTLLANGQDIQSAGHTGDDLRSLTNAQVELELKQSRKILEDIIHKSVLAIAYAQGGVNDRTMQLAGEAGYLLGLGSSPERTFSRAQLLRLPSFIIGTNMQPEDVLRIVRP